MTKSRLKQIIQTLTLIYFEILVKDTGVDTSEETRELEKIMEEVTTEAELCDLLSHLTFMLWQQAKLERLSEA